MINYRYKVQRTVLLGILGKKFTNTLCCGERANLLNGRGQAVDRHNNGEDEEGDAEADDNKHYRFN